MFIRSVLLFLLKIIGLYNLYAKFRFNSRLNAINGKIVRKYSSKRQQEGNIKEDWNSLLIVVPNNFCDKWRAGSGNFYYEIFQSAREKHPEKDIFVHFVKKDDRDWIETSIKVISDLEPDAILICPEIDPDGSGDWTVSTFVINLQKMWSGKFVFLMFDSVYPLHMWRVERLAMLVLNCKIVAIDQRLERKFRKRWNVLGPVFLPISKESINFLREKVDEKILAENLNPIRVSFVGKVYPYREKYLSAIAKKIQGFEVNPQNRFKDPEGYLSYITAIKLSKFSINLSRAGGSRVKQLKCRVLESLLFDSILVSDDKKNSGFLGIDTQRFVYVRNFKRFQLKKLVNSNFSALDSRQLTSEINSFFDID